MEIKGSKNQPSNLMLQFHFFSNIRALELTELSHIKNCIFSNEYNKRKKLSTMLLI